ncbi:tryptophan halogenase family protein [Sphingosinicella sp. BN140058]|uniref:tryptophan halogenase family protein n=1 Tax=Sphingosinicella sp. BN140058 TaxID=1892855 RepID=UPI00101077B7|nr:tryptophan halogenase family protein [Sphingosinicella sp. BN140058]QAY75338.1 tryptophan 7-halogenase [Sphingosinicella sp. BN140058]
MTKEVIVVGGGTAGWVTAAYLAKRLNAASQGGIRLTVIESPDIPVIGVGEGSFPSIRKTLSAIDIDEADLIREANATFKQGIRFADWRAPGPDGPHHYFHPFQISDQSDGLDLLPYWLMGAAGDAAWAEVNTVQKSAADACLAPKLPGHPPFAGPLTYAYHFDAVLLGRLLRKRAVALGARHVEDKVTGVELGEDGSIAALLCREGGRVAADLYVDCTGFRAQLIGEALGIPFHSRRGELFVDSAVALQVPYEQPGGPIASQTIATARSAGWIWDIGLHERRGTGYVYSSAYTDDEAALRTLRAYVGPGADAIEPRLLEFEAGYRQIQWHKNCVAIGLSSGFIEPLEATGIGFAEIAALMLVNLFPWGGDQEVSARQFNAIMVKRYDHVVDFIKLHYCLSDRADSAFWIDNRDPATWSDGLSERLERWRYRAPDFIDVDLNHDIFLAANWQYVLYGMGYKSDLGAQAGAFRYHAEARRAFADIRAQQANAQRLLPSHRALIEQARRPDFRFPKR